MSRIYAAIGCLLILGLSLAVVPAASASIIGLPNFELTLASSGSTSETLSGSSLGLTTMPDGNFTTNGSHTSLSGDANISWDLLLNPDPTISGTFAFANLLSTAKDYNLTFTLPIGTPFAPALVNGHFAGAVTDANGNGNAFLNNIAWSGSIDGLSVMSSGPSNIACDTVGCSTSQPVTYLGPVNDPSGVSGNIATHISFTLSAGDQISFSTYFDVSPIPEPGTLFLLAGMFVLAVSWQTIKDNRLIRSVAGRLSRAA